MFSLITSATNILSVLVSVVLWPFFLILSGINELCRGLTSLFLPKGYELNPDHFGNFVCSDMFNTRMVVVALFSSLEEVSLRKHISRFQDNVLDKASIEGKKIYGNLKKTQVQKFGYGCLRDDSSTFKISNHVKFYDMSQPENGSYFTEDELSRVILPEYLCNNMDGTKPQWEWLIFPRVKRFDGTFNTLRIFRWDHRYMDGACAGILMSESIFDPWQEMEPPYIYNPKTPLLPRLNYWIMLTKAWAFIHLPLMILLSVVDLLTNYFGSPRKNKQFAAWDNKGRKTVSSVHVLNIEKLKEASAAKNLNSSIKSILLNGLRSILFNNNTNMDTSITIGAFQALTPYKEGLHNQFTVLETTVKGQKVNEEMMDFQLDMQFAFPFAYISWIGRLPTFFIKKLAAPSEATVALNSVPFLRKGGSILGSKITEMASWDCLCTPVGLDITVVGYDGKMFITAFSVENCLSYKSINEIVHNYVKQLEG